MNIISKDERIIGRPSTHLVSFDAILKENLESCPVGGCASGLIRPIQPV